MEVTNMKTLYLIGIVALFLLASSMDYQDHVHYASDDTQGYELAFYHAGNWVIPCDTDTDCQEKNPHIKED